MQSLPERQPPLDRQRQLDRAEAGNMLVPNLAANAARFNKADLQPVFGLPEADEHRSGTIKVRFSER